MKADFAVRCLDLAGATGNSMHAGDVDTESLQVFHHRREGRLVVQITGQHRPSMMAHVK